MGDPAMDAQSRRFLIFTLQTSLYALDLNHVAEVSDPLQAWPIPKAPSHYIGAINFHGDVVAVMNLSLFLGLSETIIPGKLVVVRPEIAALAFLVDAVIKIAPEEEVIFISAPSGNTFEAARLSTPSGEAVLLDLETLLLCAENKMAEI